MTAPESSSGSESAWISLLAVKNEEARELTSHSMKAFFIYVAVTGGLTKFALDANATEELKVALSVFGLATAILGSLSCVFAELVRRAIRQELQAISEELTVPCMVSVLAPPKYIAFIGIAFSVLTLVGWIFVLASV